MKTIAKIVSKNENYKYYVAKMPYLLINCNNIALEEALSDKRKQREKALKVYWMLKNDNY